MVTWGFEIYENNISQDVKHHFAEMNNAGLSAREITDKLMRDYECILKSHNEQPMFWFALADMQWNYGVLQPDVKETALFWIDKECDMLNRQSSNSSSELKRAMVLNNLRSKLLSPRPPVIKTGKKRVYTCQWNYGDVFAYQLKSELAKEKGLYGRYFLIQKIDEGTWHPGHIVPIVYVKITKDANLPSDMSEYDQLEYVQTWFTKFEERFWPIDMSRPQEDIAEKSKINYQVDEYGFLPQYRALLLNTSPKIIPKELIYIGNFKNSVCPQGEFVPHSKDNIVSISWNKQHEGLETTLIKRYCGHNLRELSIYRRQDGIDESMKQ